MGPCDSDGLAFQTKINVELVGVTRRHRGWLGAREATEGVDVASAWVKLKPGGSVRKSSRPAVW